MTVFMVLCAVAAVAVLQLFWMLVPVRPDLHATVTGLDRARARAADRARRDGRGQWATASTVGAHDVGRGSLLERAGERVAELVDRRARDLTSTRQDLAITDATLQGWVTKLLGLGLAALLAPPVLMGSIGAAAQISLPVGLGVLAGAGLAVVMVVLSVRDLRHEAEQRRSEMREDMSVFLDQVTMCLEAGRAPQEALPAAVGIGVGWTFEVLRDAIETAQWSRTTAAVEFGALGRRLGASELVDLGAALELAWHDGAKMKATLAARAATLRAKRVSDVEAQANTATESMRYALLPMVVACVAYLLYPPIIGLFTG